MNKYIGVRPNKIKSLMALNKLSVIDLAKMLNITDASVYRKLRGEKEFKMSEIVALANQFDVDIEYFFSE